MENNMNKVIRDNKVAIVISPSYGSGWSTWGEKGAQERLYDPNLVAMLEAGVKARRIEAYTGKVYGELYATTDLVVVWIPVGTKFRITEYDGSESVQIRDETEWLEA